MFNAQGMPSGAVKSAQERRCRVPRTPATTAADSALSAAEPYLGTSPAPLIPFSGPHLGPISGHACDRSVEFGEARAASATGHHRWGAGLSDALLVVFLAGQVEPSGVPRAAPPVVRTQDAVPRHPAT